MLLSSAWMLFENVQQSTGTSPNQDQLKTSSLIKQKWNTVPVLIVNSGSGNSGSSFSRSLFAFSCWILLWKPHPIPKQLSVGIIF